VQHGVLVPQDQQFGVFAQISSHQHSGQTEQPSHQLIQDRQQHHPTIIHDRPAHEDRRSGRHTEYSSPIRNARWFLLGMVDSATGSNADGSGVAFRKRDPQQFRALLACTVMLYRRLVAEWSVTAEHYRAEVPELTSVLGTDVQRATNCDGDSQRHPLDGSQREGVLQRRDRVVERGCRRHRSPGKAFAGCDGLALARGPQVAPGAELNIVHGLARAVDLRGERGLQLMAVRGDDLIDHPHESGSHCCHMRLRMWQTSAPGSSLAVAP